MYRDYNYDYEKVGIQNPLFEPSTGGYIKDSPNDFMVEEVNKEVRSDSNGEFTYFTLVKKNWTTMRALRKIASKCHVSWKRFKFAGTKDKHAVTHQLVNVKDVKPVTLRRIQIKDLEIRNVFKSDDKIRIGELEGNKFTIRVNDYRKEKVRETLEEFATYLQDGVPNYYGEQRFGIQRPNNHIVGKLILYKEYEEAMKELLAQTYPGEGGEGSEARNYLKQNWKKWKTALHKFPKYLSVERIILNHLREHPSDYVNALRKLPKNIAKIFVYSYQSYLFNKTLSRLVEKDLLTDFRLDIPGYATELNKIGGAVMEEVMNEEGVTLTDFKVNSYPEISCRGTVRPAVIYPKEYKIKEVSKNHYNISFKLPKGSYATILMRELIQ